MIPLALYEGKRLQAIRFGGSEYGDNFGVASAPADQGEVAEAAAEALQDELGACCSSYTGSIAIRTGLSGLQPPLRGRSR